jgi:GT2 family glycosyltransferase
MSTEPALGALGSLNRAVSSVEFPQWFSSYCQYYAAADHYGSSTMPKFMLNGAGMTIRREAWREMEQNGFRSQLSDRVGDRLSSCGDIEWGFALALAGWKFRLEPRLSLEHYLSVERLRWSYLRRLLRSVGESQVVLDGYYYVEQQGPAPKDRLRQQWWWHFLAEAEQLVRAHSPLKLVRAYFTEMEGNDDAADIELRFGRLLGFLALRSRYAAIRRDIACAPWRRRDSLFGAADGNP